MTDISKCLDSTCPSKDTCYRWLAKSDPYRQRYSRFDRKGEEKCEAYLEAKSKSQMKRLDAMNETP